MTKSLGVLRRDGMAEALATLGEARAIANRIGSRHTAALVDIQTGCIRLECGDFDGALAALTTAAEASELLTPREHCALLINRSHARAELGSLDPAREDLAAASELATAEGLPEALFRALHGLGIVDYLSGNIPDGLRHMRAAAEVDFGGERAIALRDQAQVLLEAGLIDTAVSVLNDALDDARTNRLTLEEGEIQLDLARAAILLDDTPAALDAVRAAIDAFHSRGAGPRARYARLIRATVDVTSGHAPPSLPPLRVADDGVALVATTPDDRIALRLHAETALLNRDPATARTMMTALHAAPTRSIAGTLHEAVIEARLCLLAGEPARARAAIRLANIALGRSQREVQSLEVRAGLAFHARRLRDLDVSLALDNGSAAAVLESAERWRAASFRLPPISPPEDPEDRTLLTQLRAARTALLSADTHEAERLQRVAAALEQDIRGRAMSRGAGDEAAERIGTATVPAIVERLRPGQVLVMCVDRGDDLYAVVVADGAARLTFLGSTSEITKLVQRCLRDLIASVHAAALPRLAATTAAAAQASLRALDGHLTACAVGQLARDVVIVPSPSLMALPWGQLPSLAGCRLLVAPSLSRWVALTNPHHEVSTEASDPSTPTQVPVRALAGPDLARARQEVAEVLRLWGQPQDDGLAHSEDVVGALSTATIVHLAAHGRHAEQSPLFSSALLADGPVHAHEFPRPCRTQHVILSACDVGRATVRPGDEPLGLSAALLALGVQCVIAAPIPVDDAVAESVMVAYHRHLIAGASATEALAAATTEVPAAAAFTAYGSDWRLR